MQNSEYGEISERQCNDSPLSDRLLECVRECFRVCS